MSEDSELEPVLSPQSPPELAVDDIIGLEKQVTEIKQTLIESAVGCPPTSYRIMTLMLYGPMGAGKRRLARATAGELGQQEFAYEHIESLSRSNRRPAEMLTEVFDEAIDQQPIVLMLDCFDDIFSSDAVRTYETYLEDIQQSGEEVFVVSVVDEKEMRGSIEEFIRANNITLEVERPDIARRKGILRDRLEDVSEQVEGVDAASYDFDRLARKTDRFGLNDLEAVGQRAAVTSQTDIGTQPPLTEDDIIEIVTQVDQERMEKIQDEATLTDVDIPDITFDDIGGHEEAKRVLVERVQHALAQNEVADELGINFGGGILLHGPPGTGKTMLVRALANELDHTFIPVNGPTLKAGCGGPANQIPVLFYRAQRNAPAILFFDEFDSLGTCRGTPHNDDSAVNTLLTELDGVESVDEIVVIAATNRPQSLDPALLRSGRFDYHLEIDRPDTETQAEIFAKQTTDLPLAADVTPEWFAEMVDRVTGADIAAICDRAVTIASRDQDDLTPADLTLTREVVETAYDEFESGRLYDTDLDASPAFQ